MRKPLLFLITIFFVCGNLFAADKEVSEERSRLDLIKEAYIKMERFYFKEIDKKSVGNLFYRSQIMMINLLSNPGENYLTSLDKLTYSTINLIVEALKDPSDKYSKFIYRDYLERVVREHLKSNFDGIGIEVEEKAGLFFIAKVYKDSSANEEKVLEGDQLIAINGEKVEGKKLSEIDKQLKIANGKTVKLELVHPQEKDSYVVFLECRIISVPTVSSKYYKEKKIGYIKISRFRDETAKETTEELKVLEKKGIKGLVLDLRGNSGGDETQAVALASMFLAKDSLVVFFVKKDVGRQEERVKGGQRGCDYPIVILVDKKTGSSSEIFSGAMKYYNKAVLVGENTAGYGSLKNTAGLKDGSALFLITSRTYLPDGETFDEVGVSPNFVVQGRESQLEKGFDIISGLAAK